MAAPDHERAAPIRLSAEEARGGEIVLTNRRRKFVFFGGLVLFVLFALIGTLLSLR